MSSLPEPRTRGAADILGDKLYYVAGFNSGADSGGDPIFLEHMLSRHDCHLWTPGGAAPSCRYVFHTEYLARLLRAQLSLWTPC